MSEAYAYLVRHTHRTWLGLRRRDGRTVLKLAKPIDSPEALEVVERLLAEQLGVHPSGLLINGFYLLSAPAGSAHDGLSLARTAEAAAESTRAVAERWHEAASQYQSARAQLTATDVGLYRARALLEGLSQQHGPHEHVGRHRDSELGQMLYLVRGDLANYPPIFAEGQATPEAVERVMHDTGKHWDRTCLIPNQGRSGLYERTPTHD